MKAEIEAKFLDINHDEIREKLEKLGATCEQPMRLMRRVTIDTPDMKSKDAFLRVRDEGHRVTMTYKQFDSLSVDGAKEIEVIVSDFDATIQLLTAAGLPYSSFQESKRETWHYDDVEIVLDEWPWLKTYIEVESHSEQKLHDIASKLDLNWSSAVFGDVMAAYRVEYPHLSEKQTVGRLPIVKFGDPLPNLLKSDIPHA
ncbi:MAG: class IV adenylate cyclase [Candidatus Saccharimonadales bacterium]